MHALVIGPLTSRLRDSLRQNLMEKKSNPSQEPLTSNSDDNSEVMKNDAIFANLIYITFVLQLNSDEFLNVDLLLEEAMHALVIGPLTSRLRDSLRQNLMEKKSNPSQEPLTSNSDDNSEIMKNEVAFVTQQTLNAFKDCFIQMKNSVSPLDKLAHMLTGLKVITNAVSFVYLIYLGFFELLKVS